jgi:hypothetical protein
LIVRSPSGPSLGPLICITGSRSALASRCASASPTPDALIAASTFSRHHEWMRSSAASLAFWYLPIACGARTAATAQLPQDPATKPRVRWPTVRLSFLPHEVPRKPGPEAAAPECARSQIHSRHQVVQAEPRSLPR